MQIEIPRQQSELLEHNLRTLEAFGILIIIQPIINVLRHLLSTRKLTFDFLLDGVTGVFAQPAKRFIDRGEELPGFLWSDLALCGRRGWLYLDSNISFSVLGWRCCAGSLGGHPLSRSLINSSKNRAAEQQKQCTARRTGLHSLGLFRSINSGYGKHEISWIIMASSTASLVMRSDL